MGAVDALDELRRQVEDSSAKRILFLPHAVQRMLQVATVITTQEVREALSAGEIIEHYPEDVRGHSCLILGWTEDGRPLHVVCAPKSDYLAVITVYEPSPKKWEPDFKTRKR